MALEVRLRYPNESSMAVCVLKNPLQHIPMAVNTAMALPFRRPSAMKRGMRPKAAPTAPSDVIGKANSSGFLKPKSHSKMKFLCV